MTLHRVSELEGSDLEGRPCQSVGENDALDVLVRLGENAQC